MDFKYIPIKEISLLNEKYTTEILRIVHQKNNNSQNILMKCLSKILKEDFTLEKKESFGVKVKDFFQGKKLSFIIDIKNEFISNQLEIRLNIKQIVYGKFSDSNQELIKYLKKEILGIIFRDLLTF